MRNMLALILLAIIAIIGYAFVAKAEEVHIVSGEGICVHKDSALSIVEIWKQENYQSAHVLFQFFVDKGECFDVDTGTVIVANRGEAVLKDILKADDEIISVEVFTIVGQNPPHGVMYVLKNTVLNNKKDTSS